MTELAVPGRAETPSSYSGVELKKKKITSKAQPEFRLSLPRARTLGCKMSENFEQPKAEYEAFRESSTQLEYELESEVTRVNGLWRVSEEKLRQSEKQRISMKNILTEEVREL